MIQPETAEVAVSGLTPLMKFWTKTGSVQVLLPDQAPAPPDHAPAPPLQAPAPPAQVV